MGNTENNIKNTISENNLKNAIKNTIYEILWIDPEIQNGKNKHFLKDLKSLDNFKINCFTNVIEALNKIKKISFEQIYIVICEKLNKEFIEEFKKNINDIYIIPKIILILDNKEKYLNENQEYIKNNPFYFNFISTNFNEILNYILNPQKINNKKNLQEFSFEYADSKSFCSNNGNEEFIELLDKKYSKFPSINKLLNQIKFLDVDNIPIELLSKYYLRLYLHESDFYKDLNQNLRQNQKLYYLPYINTLYKGIKLKSFPIIIS